MVSKDLSSTGWMGEPISTQPKGSEIDAKCWVNAFNSGAKE